MGRRSVNSTKRGKYMNPTDQARKEARRKELKKNKKQRMAVRHAVLKNKDPRELLQELEKIDKMEYSVDSAAPLSEKVLKEKRKKLKETLERVLKLYEKEDPEYWADIRRSESEYEKRRGTLITYYESVKHAQSVQVEEIPLPVNLLPETEPDQIPLPPAFAEIPAPPTVGILKPRPDDRELAPVRRGPPGVPPGPPPPLYLEEDDDVPEDTRPPGTEEGAVMSPREAADAETSSSEDEEMDQDDEPGGSRRRTIRFQEEDDDDEADDGLAASDRTSKLDNMQLRMLQMSGQDIDSFMKESEQLMRQKNSGADDRAVPRRDRDERRGDRDERRDRGDRDERRDRGDRDERRDRGDRDERRDRGDRDERRDRGDRDERRDRGDVDERRDRDDRRPDLNIPTPAAALAPQTGVDLQARLRAAAAAQIPPPVAAAPAVQAAPQSLAGVPLPPPVAAAVEQPPQRPPLVPPGPPPGVPPMLLRPPPPGLRLPPGPPPGLPPRIRMPPGPPPGVPPRLARPGGTVAPPPQTANPNVLSAAPQLRDKQPATIEAKPQIRNLGADVTRFVPSALRVKRDDKRKQDKKTNPDGTEAGASQPQQKPTKDDAYALFMSEMQGLL